MGGNRQGAQHTDAGRNATSSQWRWFGLESLSMNAWLRGWISARICRRGFSGSASSPPDADRKQLRSGKPLNFSGLTGWTGRRRRHIPANKPQTIGVFSSVGSGHHDFANPFRLHPMAPLPPDDSAAHKVQQGGTSQRFLLWSILPCPPDAVALKTGRSVKMRLSFPIFSE